MEHQPVPAPGAWTDADVQSVGCCVCGDPGTLRNDLPPFRVVRCPRCGLVFVNPRLRPEALQRLYDDTGYFEGGVYGGEHSAAMLLQRAWTAGRLDLIRSAWRGTGPPRLLEVGCGYGHFLAAARRRGYDVTGVELSGPAAECARDRLGLTVYQGQLAEVDLAGGFDVIAAWDTLEHVPDPVAFLRTARGLLRDDGLLAFSTPYVTSLPARLLGARWWTLKPAEHIWHYSPATHRLVGARAGFAVSQIVRSPLAKANLGRLDSLVGIAYPLPAGATEAW